MTSTAESLRHALRMHREGQYAEAERVYREILRAEPDHPDAPQLLGLLEHRAGRHEAAVDLIARAIALAPAAAALHVNLGEAFRCLGRIDDAIRCYRQAIALDPAITEAHFNLGVVCTERGQHREAIEHYRQVLAVRRDHADALNNLGHALGATGAMEDAAACLRRALECRPGFAEAHNNLGKLYLGMGRYEDARAQFERALALRPGFALALANLGALAQEEGRLAAAIAWYRRALETDPALAGVWTNLGGALAEQGKWLEAREALARALQTKPSDALRLLHGLVLPSIPESSEQMHEARRGYAASLEALSGRSLSIADPLAEVNSVPFYLAYHGENDRELQRTLARLYERACPDLGYRAPHGGAPAAPTSGRSIHIGFVSRIIGRHSVARRLMSGLIGRLSRERFRVSVYSFPHARNDDLAQMSACADRVVMLPPVLAAARERLDALCYVDIGMEPITYFLAFARLAPLQFATWQHPVTTGIPNVDCFLSSSLIEPEGAETHYSERLVRLDALPTWYERPELPPRERQRSALGLKEGRTQYVCPQSPFKIHPDFDRLIGDILRADPAGEVVLLEGKIEDWARSLLDRIRRTIPDVAGRVRFVRTLPHEDFQHLLACADVLLDPLHWSGGITTLDALAFGTPVVTLPGALMRGRVTYGCYRQMGMLDCVARDASEYVALALGLGTDRERRQAMRAKILAHNTTLYRNDSAVTQFEEFVRGALAGHLFPLSAAGVPRS
jgi:predicted O-linked N-acetylglucosamine transferase (SPINDLY family)